LIAGTQRGFQPRMSSFYGSEEKVDHLLGIGRGGLAPG
jgi:hypothetical protein